MTKAEIMDRKEMLLAELRELNAQIQTLKEECEKRYEEVRDLNYQLEEN